MTVDHGTATHAGPSLHAVSPVLDSGECNMTFNAVASRPGVLVLASFLALSLVVFMALVIDATCYDPIASYHDGIPAIISQVCSFTMLVW